MTPESEREILLSAARASITARLNGQKFNPEDILSPNVSPPSGSGGAFVTLKKGNRLRGCIGHLESSRPIIDTIAELACSAAFSDPRFPPLGMAELDEVCIEISRLSEFLPIRASDVEVGRHGLLLRLGSRSGLLLPQVPVEQGWDRSVFLSMLCNKAGLPDRTWDNPNAVLEGFTAEIFKENR
ncbi:MAG: hypothetical protein B6D68_00070 [spirochete symbiont of Stewartia floridana]|nr:MAG: hypothetical protein B6D68_00070 [spirochete symbiont of Stewartia floridana]